MLTLSVLFFVLVALTRKLHHANSKGFRVIAHNGLRTHAQITQPHMYVLNIKPTLWFSWFQSTREGDICNTVQPSPSTLHIMA